MSSSSESSAFFVTISKINFVFFVKDRLIFNVFYCFCMFVNKYFANFTGKSLENS